ncbi:uncharacterized protein [Ptychodera flava]|uniref:uncharacterized protein n=1 Tax=Ptychodera flava TaxID=63121 RepID=UPI00396A8D70
MELSSSQGFIQSSPYAAMNDLLFKQFGFQVLANNICKEDTDTYPILVQSVLRESDVEIWGGFRVHAYIVKLDFQKTQGQPEISLAILLKNKFTPDVKRLGAPFQLKAYHLQWIQNVLDEDVDGMPVRNSKEIPFIAMYDAINLSEAETLTKNLESLIGSEITILLETKGGTGHHQSTMREKSHDLSPADTSQEVSSKTVDKNKQALEIFSTDLNNENERKTIKGQNQEAFADVSHDDGNLEPTADKSETCESSEDLANIPNTDTDKRLRAELSTKESNLEMKHRGINSMHILLSLKCPKNQQQQQQKLNVLTLGPLLALILTNLTIIKLGHLVMKNYSQEHNQKRRALGLKKLRPRKIS